MKRALRMPTRAGAIFFLSALLFLILLPVLCPATSLTILHTNDTHSHLLPFSYPTAIDPCSPATALPGLPGGTNIGGIARRATLVKQIRGEMEAKGIPVWLGGGRGFLRGDPFP